MPGQDPCDTSGGPIADPTTAAQCAEQGVPASFQNPVSQIRTKIGGNPDLEAESAGVLTAGIVLEPPAIDGLAITLDYFRFDIDNAIQSQGLEVILSNCYVQGNDDACALITRRPGTGVIDFVTDTETNVGGNDTSGIDVAIAYDHELGGVGRFRHQLEGTRLLEYTETGADGRVIDGLGVYDLGVYPKWRANWSTVWGKGGAGAGANVRFVGRFDECEDNACNDGKPSRQVERNVTADLFASYTFANEAGTSTLAVGVNNVLDQEPAVIFGGFLADSDASTYDYLGRYFYARLTHAF